MSLGRVYTVWCDASVLPVTGPNGTGCHSWIAQATSGAEARAEARAEGWKRMEITVHGNPEGRGDACPACTRAMKETRHA